MKLIPTICYFPTTAVFVDDSKTFLSMIDFNLQKRLTRKLYSDPIKALKYVENQQKHHVLQQLLTTLKTTELDVDDNTNCVLDINLETIHNEIYNKDRFNQISVVVVDYDMPQLNGLDFCRTLNNREIKKVLLTCKADHKLAVDAFNDGIIDKFILKENESDLFNKLNNIVFEGQFKYFNRINGFDGVVTKILQSKHCFLEAQKFIDFFDSLCKKINPVEFYLLDNRGSYLFLDEKANATWLLLKTADDLNELYNTAIEHDAHSSVIAGLKNKKFAPVFLEKNGSDKSPSFWDVRPIKPLVDDDFWCYSLICDEKHDFLNYDKILPYQKFCDI